MKQEQNKAGQADATSPGYEQSSNTVLPPAVAPSTDEKVTPQMLEAGVTALREWLDNDDRFLGWDHLAVRDAFLAMDAVRSSVRT